MWAHTARYQFARPWVKQRSVLDAGSGEGYGTYYLSQSSRRAMGIDISPDTVQAASRRYIAGNLTYRCMSCERIDLPDSSVDVVTSFEVIEHLCHPERLVTEARRVLSPGGLFLVSTPNVNSNFPAGDNPYHTKEYTPAEFHHILAPHFETVEFYGQICKRRLREYLFHQSTRLYLRSALYRNVINRLAPIYFKGNSGDANSADAGWVDRINPGTFDFVKDNLNHATYIVAVCRKAAS
jgi:SAM-dependent methyltransferase